MNQSISALSDSPVTAVVHRRIKSGQEEEYERVMHDFAKDLLQQPGSLGVNIVRHQGEPRSYTVFDRFATAGDRARFKSSAQYQAWMERLLELSEKPPEIEEAEGVSLLFDLPADVSKRLPSKIRMAVVTLTGVYPLAVLMPAVVAPLTAGWPLAARQFVIATLTVAALTWLVLPIFTRLFHRWLFPPSTAGGSE